MVQIPGVDDARDAFVALVGANEPGAIVPDPGSVRGDVDEHDVGDVDASLPEIFGRLRDIVGFGDNVHWQLSCDCPNHFVTHAQRISDDGSLHGFPLRDRARVDRKILGRLHGHIVDRLERGPRLSVLRALRIAEDIKVIQSILQWRKR